MSTIQKRFSSMLALLILGTAGAYAVVWQNDETAEKKERKRDEQAVFDLRSIKEIKEVELEGPKHKLFFKRSEQGRWVIEQPIADEADQAAVNSLLRYMLEAKRLRSVGDEQDGVVLPPKDLVPYGLDKPNYRFAFTSKAGVKEQLLIGRDTRFDKNYYAKRAGAPDVFLIAYGLEFQYERELDGFRDKRFLELPLKEVRSIEVKSSKSAWKIEKKEDKFWLQDPVDALADMDQVRGILNVVESLEIKTFLAEPIKPEGPIKERVEISVLGREDEETKLTLIAYGEGSTSSVYAQATGPAARKAQAMLQVDGAISRLQVLAATMEDRRIARFDRELVTAVRVFSGPISLFFKKTADGFWRLEGEERQIKPGVMQGLLYNLRRLRADELGVQNPDEKLLKKAGLETTPNGLELIGLDSKSMLTLFLGTKTGENQMVLSSGRLDRVKQSDLSMLHFEAEKYLEPVK
jgi:hypothetical protein